MAELEHFLVGPRRQGSVSEDRPRGVGDISLIGMYLTGTSWCTSNNQLSHRLLGDLTGKLYTEPYPAVPAQVFSYFPFWTYSAKLAGRLHSKGIHPPEMLVPVSHQGHPHYSYTSPTP